MDKNRWVRILAVLLAVTLFWVLNPTTGRSAVDVFAVKSTSPASATGSFETDRVPGEVLASADTIEEAHEIALFYDLELLSHAYGIAVYATSDPELLVQQSQAVPQSDLPRLFLNRLYNALETESTPLPVPDGKESAIRTDAAFLQYHHEEMDSTSAWTLSQGSGVIVAVIDTGIDINHSKFLGRISSVSFNSHTRQVGLSHVRDDHGHGTHVCGIVAAANDGSGGICGIAPKVELLVIKADRPSDHRFEAASILRAVAYAVENGAAVINLSLGTPFSTGSVAEEYAAYLKAIGQGVTIVCAAGNERGSHATYPAAYPETIAVSAVKQGYQFDGNYSNYGPEIDITAQGTNIYSTTIGGGYTTLTGTSMSAPIVSGIVALIKSIHPNYTPQKIKAVLCETARDAGILGWDQYYGHGVANSYSALLGAEALYTVTYNLNDGSRPPVSTRVVPGGRLIELEKPTRGEYDFLGWFRDVGGSGLFDFASPISANITLFAQWKNPALPAVYTVSGIVKSYNPGLETTARLMRNGTAMYTTKIASATGSGQIDQPFVFGEVAPGTYDLEFTKDVHTKATLKNVVVVASNLDLTKDARANIRVITLLCGDINGDGDINVTDLNVLWSAENYNKSTAKAVNRLADLNGDGDINVSDLNVLWSAANYNQSTLVLTYGNDGNNP